MNTRPSTGRLVAGLLTLTAFLAACAGGAAAPSASPSPPLSDAPVTAPPSDPGASTDPASLPPIGAKPIVPQPGLAVDVHPIAAEQLAARVDGNRIIVTAVWTSGVEPCTILDSIVVDKGEGTYTVTLNEGSNPQEIACIAIAEQHITEFEIPNVAPGTWTIVDSGGMATPVEVTVG
jgi:ABC-type transport system substrate-binding protein